MKSGVWIGKSNTGNYDLISAGDYINPFTVSFRLKDQRTTIGQDNTLYLIINDISVEYIKVEITGKLTFIRCYLSLDNENWSSKIEIRENIDATNNTIIKPFYIRVVCDDFLEYFSLTGETLYRTYKLKLIYI